MRVSLGVWARAASAWASCSALPPLFVLVELLLGRQEGLLLLLVRRALARVVVADARAEGAVRGGIVLVFGLLSFSPSFIFFIDSFYEDI